MKEDSFVLDAIKFAICIITLFLFFAFLVFMWKWGNAAYEDMNRSTKLEGYEVIHYTKSCIDNKQFIKYRSGITIDLDMNGKPIHCNFEKAFEEGANETQ